MLFPAALPPRFQCRIFQRSSKMARTDRELSPAERQTSERILRNLKEPRRGVRISNSTREGLLTMNRANPCSPALRTPL
jgi:hypothetical protein